MYPYAPCFLYNNVRVPLHDVRCSAKTMTAAAAAAMHMQIATTLIIEFRKQQ